MKVSSELCNARCC